MAGSLNKVLLIGRLGNDPETREFPNGGKVCNFSLATSESWKDNNTGERQEKTNWHNIAIFNERLAEIAEQYLNGLEQNYYTIKITILHQKILILVNIHLKNLITKMMI